MSRVLFFCSGTVPFTPGLMADERFCMRSMSEKIAYATFHGERGLVATADIPANETIIRVPRDFPMRGGYADWKCPFPAFVNAVFWSKASL